MVAEEERAALRTFLRALRPLPAGRGLARDGLVVAAARDAGDARRALRERVRFIDSSEQDGRSRRSPAPT